jgi:hypothetical protein
VGWNDTYQSAKKPTIRQKFFIVQFKRSRQEAQQVKLRAPLWHEDAFMHQGSDCIWTIDLKQFD